MRVVFAVATVRSASARIIALVAGGLFCCAGVLFYLLLSTVVVSIALVVQFITTE